MILRLLLAGIILVSAVAGYKYWLTQKSFSVLHETPFGNAIGPEDADITLVEIVDYRCSFCREVHPVITEFHEKIPMSGLCSATLLFSANLRYMPRK